jgi:uncharacterized protein YndB with AHSA1/START domain
MKEERTMTDTQTSTAPSLVLRRVYSAPRERVYAAWTQPDIAARFMGPGDTTSTDIQMDVRPGGAFRITMVRPDGDRFVALGIYRDVQPPERLSMTWRWQEDDPAEEHESLLTLEFLERGEQTELVLTHAQLADVDSRDRHAHGWTPIVDQLAGIL